MNRPLRLRDNRRGHLTDLHSLRHLPLLLKVQLLDLVLLDFHHLDQGEVGFVEHLHVRQRLNRLIFLPLEVDGHRVLGR